MQLTLIGRRLRSGAPYLELTERANIVVAGAKERSPHENFGAPAPPVPEARRRREANAALVPSPSSFAAGAMAVLACVAQSGPQRCSSRRPPISFVEHRGGRPFRLRRRAQGHTGQGIALSADGNTMAVVRRARRSGATGVNGDQRDNCVRCRRRLRLHPRRRRLDPAGLSQGLERRRARVRSAVALSADGNTLAVSASWEAEHVRASTAIRRTSRAQRRRGLRVPAPGLGGRSRPTSRRRTPARRCGAPSEGDQFASL